MKKHKRRRDNSNSYFKTKIRGKLQIAPGGFGFVTPENGGRDIFISSKNISNALDGDIVEVIPERGRRGSHTAGRITDIVSRSNDKFIGIFRKTGKKAWILSEDRTSSKKFLVVRDNTGRVKNGDRVVGKIKYFGSIYEDHRGDVIDILDDVSEYRNDINSFVYTNIPDHEFPKEVLKESRSFKYIDIHSEASFKNDRKDLRDLTVFTIDDVTAKDMDDAVSLDVTDEGYILGVHIADVSHFVKKDSFTDKEALKRGTSIYLPGKVIPMLPPSLSDDLCSLREDADRYALSVFISLDKEFRATGSRIVKSMIRSRKKMSYDCVDEILENGKVPEGYEEFADKLVLMGQVSNGLRERRTEKGMIMLDLPEAYYIYDDDGNINGIKKRKSGKASELIEEFMILANTTVASCFEGKDLPFIYRVHERPDAADTDALFASASLYGVNSVRNTGNVSSSDIAGFLDSVKDSEFREVFHRLTARSMKEARYTGNNIGHFALAEDNYCHFTSPIRRYPDLFIHRAVKKYLLDNCSHDDITYSKETVENIALDCSAAERNAADLERKAEKIVKARFMDQFTGDVFEGRISGITEWGIFVELENTVEGMIPLSFLYDDNYEPEANGLILKGQRTGKQLRTGDPISVIIRNADTERGRIDLDIAET